MNVLKAIRLILTLNCQQSTRLVSDALDRQLSFSEKWAVRLHAIGCWSCRRFRRHLLLVQHAARLRGELHLLDGNTSYRLSDETRQRFQRELRKAHDEVG